MKPNVYFFIALGIVLLALISFSFKNVPIHGEVPISDTYSGGLGQGGDELPPVFNPSGFSTGGLSSCAQFGPEKYSQVINQIQILFKQKRDILKDVKVEGYFTAKSQASLESEDPMANDLTTYQWGEETINSIINERNYSDGRLGELNSQTTNVNQIITNLNNDLSSLNQAISNISNYLSTSVVSESESSYYENQIVEIKNTVALKQQQIVLNKQNLENILDEESRIYERVGYLDFIINNIVPVEDIIKSKISEVNQAISYYQTIINNCYLANN